MIKQAVLKEQLNMVLPGGRRLPPGLPDYFDENYEAVQSMLDELKRVPQENLRDCFKNLGKMFAKVADGNAEVPIELVRKLYLYEADFNRAREFAQTYMPPNVFNSMMKKAHEIIGQYELDAQLQLPFRK